jgi:hypothetical protein
MNLTAVDQRLGHPLRILQRCRLKCSLLAHYAHRREGRFLLTHTDK